MAGEEREVLPPEGAASGPFWDGTREQKLVLQWCRACERPIHFPRLACPGCMGDEFDYREAAGTGEVYAVTVRPEARPVALVDLPEGVRLMTNLTTELPVGAAVRVHWKPLSDGRHLPYFEGVTP